MALLGAIGMVSTLSFGLVPALAAANPPSLFWESPEDGLPGPGAGRLDVMEGIAVSPISGDIYAADRRNARVDEFDAWGQFVKAWGWGVVNGAPELQTCGPGASPPTVTCEQGLKGNGPGQFKLPLGGIVVSAGGDVYVGDMENHRVEKFDSDGHFLLSFGEAGDGPGQFESESGPSIAAAPDGVVYVGDIGRIEAFEPDGSFRAEIRFEGDLATLNGARVQSLAVDSAGNIYVSAQGVGEIFKINPAGALVSPGTFPLGPQITGSQAIPPQTVAVDATGNVYAAPENQVDRFLHEVVEFAPSGTPIIPVGAEFAVTSQAVEGLATSNACGISGFDLYLAASDGESKSVIRAYGSPPDPAICPPPAKAPMIASQFGVSANAEGAFVKARINPHFWTDTTYHVEYGTGKCSEGGCLQKQPVPDGPLGEAVTNLPETTPGVFLSDLQPGSTYHFRFVAQSSGGGPTVGIGEDEKEGTFTTPPASQPPPSPDPCPNSAFRLGVAISLADCRAYEMVSPVEKSNGDITTLLTSLNEPAALDQSAESGDKFTYSSFQAFGDPQSAPATSQYMASRGATGWTSAGISPPRGITREGTGATLESQFRAFTPDLCTGWIRHDTDPPLTTDAIEHFPNVYEASLCGSEEAYKALTTTVPVGVLAEKYEFNVQGMSADGKRVAVRANAKLTNNAAASTKFQCYEYTEKGLKLLSILPSGAVSSGNCSIGTANRDEGFRSASVSNAVSEDGTHIFWSVPIGGRVSGPGRIYLRVNGKNPSVAVSEAGEAESNLSAEEGSQFFTAAADGSKAIFAAGKLGSGKADLYEFDVAGEETRLIAPEVKGFLGASDDATQIYFSSLAVLAGENDEGHSPEAGQPNLYLYDSAEGGSFRFVGVLSEQDAQTEFTESAVSPLANQTNRHVAQVTPDGEAAAFMATAPMTGFDNVDAVTNEPDFEVFLYDATAEGGAGRLLCVSCNPTRVAPTGSVPSLPVPMKVGVAGRITPPVTQMYAPQDLTEDGKRLFFESYESLVPGDTNGQQDVYEWEAPGEGPAEAVCTTGSPAYSPSARGCITLISSGKSPQESEFLDSAAGGRDAFFTTGSSLVAQDPGLVDVYDAREGGGFSPPPAPAVPCQGEACQGQSSPPAEETPASAGYRGPGNVPPPKSKPCPKGTRQVKKGGKTSCAHQHRKTKHGKKRRKAKAKGRAVR